MSDPRVPASQHDLEAFLPYLVNRLATLGQTKQNRMLAASGLNLVILRTLSILQIEDGLTINEIAARTFTEQSSTSRAVDAMVDQALVERRIPAHDQRRREVVLTDAGRERLRAGWPAMTAYFDAVSDGTTAEERDTCRRVLMKMIANLDTLNP